MSVFSSGSTTPCCGFGGFFFSVSGEVLGVVGRDGRRSFRFSSSPSSSPFLSCITLMPVAGTPFGGRATGWSPPGFCDAGWRLGLLAAVGDLGGAGEDTFWAGVSGEALLCNMGIAVERYRT